MPVHDEEECILGAIDSVSRQTLPDWELIVVDDGSTDTTREKVREQASADSRIHLLEQQHGGAAAARNLGASTAGGVMLAFLDADDRFEPDYLATMASLSQMRPDVDVFACNAWNEYRDSSRRPTYPDTDSVREIVLEDEVRAAEIPVYSAVRRSAFERVGGFRDVYAEDYDLWVRLLASGSLAVRHPRPLVHYDARMSGKSGAREEQLASVRRTLLGLLDDARVTPDVARLARRRIRQLEAQIALLPVKQRLRTGDAVGARQAFVTHRHALRGPKGFLTLALVLVSPKAYARMARRQDPNAD